MYSIKVRSCRVGIYKMVTKENETQEAGKVVSPENEKIAMCGTFDISSATEFKDTLQKALDLSPNIIIDAKELDKITTPCIQLLLSASKSANKNKGKLTLDGFSEDMEKAFSDLGFIDQFNEWKENE